MALVVAQHWHAMCDLRWLCNAAGFGGVPIGGAAHLVAQMVAVAVFDGDLDFFLKVHRIFEMVDVGGLVAVGIVLVDRGAVAQEGVVLHAPGLVEIIFAAGAVQFGRPFVAVDPNHIVALAPPGALEVGDAEVAANKVAAALGLENHIVVVPGELTLVGDIGLGGIDLDFVSPATEGIFPAELGVKITRFLGDVTSFIIDVEVLAVPFPALVNQLYECPFAKGHLHVCVEGTALVEAVVLPSRSGKKQRLVGVDDAVAETEEVAQGADDARGFGVVPGDLEQAFAVVIGLSHPEVGDAAGAFDIGERYSLAGFDPPGIAIAAIVFPGRGAAGFGVADVTKLIEHMYSSGFYCYGH